MQKSIQIIIIELLRRLAIYGPYCRSNIEVYKLFGGHYDSANRRWIVPYDDTSRPWLDRLFGAPSPSVIVRIKVKDLTPRHSQLLLVGYLVGAWDNRKQTVWSPDGVELVSGSWDLPMSAAKKSPCLNGPDCVFHVVVRRSFAEANGLNIVEELGEEPITNPLANYAVSDLKAELEDRGYTVVQEIC